MAQIGDASTSRFFISQAEVRIGPLTSAMALTQAHSVGLLNSATVTFNIESVDLEAGLPRKLFDTQVISQLGSVSMEMREYSRRNMQMLLGYSPDAYVSRVETTLAAPVTKATGTSIVVQAGDGADFAEGDLVGIYPASAVNQANLTYAEVTGVATDTLSLGPYTLPLLFDYAANDKVFKATPVAIGANSTTQYFSVQVLGSDRRGLPVGFIFWKCAMSSGLEVGFNSDDFNSNSGELKILSPSAADLAVGGDLHTVAAQVAKYPLGMSLFGGDVA